MKENSDIFNSTNFLSITFIDGILRNFLEGRNKIKNEYDFSGLKIIRQSTKFKKVYLVL